jgi:hypothetical protein
MLAFTSVTVRPGIDFKADGFAPALFREAVAFIGEEIAYNTT